ncbi:hypothetical protein [Ruminococcus albus]|uniref:Lipoprotein n=1 Tax=Ruminococcus albus TaxID=1264 RepID=A0A1I1G270_RUMAL|nr:hypothetical protein [Ruminococcus albus]SFC03393.1 hypothetical protein SAMN02910406_01032 [Ruminococcus albus]
MKMIVLPIVAAVTILAGCGAERASVKPEKLSGDIHKSAEITYFGREYKAELRRGGEGIWEFGFTEPESLAGLKMTYNSESCRMELDDLEYQCDSVALPEYGLMPLLAGALETLIEGRDVSCTDKGDHTVETGETAGQKFAAKVRNGELTELEVERALTVRFR